MGARKEEPREYGVLSDEDESPVASMKPELLKEFYKDKSSALEVLLAANDDDSPNSAFGSRALEGSS